MKEEPAISTSFDLFSRLRQISPELAALDRKPLITKEYRFPFEELAKALSKQFATNISIQVDQSLWKTKEEVEKEKATLHLDQMDCSIFGVSSPFSFLFPQNLMSNILSALLHDSIAIENQPQELFEAFKAFFLASVVATAKESPGWKNSSIQLIDHNELSQTAGFFTYQCSISIGTFSFPLLIALPPEFLDKLRAIPRKKEYGSEDWLSQLPIIPISIEAARTHAPLNLIKQLRAGDILFVDFPFFFPNSERARVILTYRGIPLFRAKVKNGVLKLLEMSNMQQAFQPLVRLSSALSNQEKTMTADTQDTNPTFTSEEVNNKEEAQIEKQEQEVTASPPAQPISFQDLPLLVVVQLKELSMALEQIQALQAGNLLDLDIHPEQTTVQLVVQGHTIAEGDLVAIGDKLGVRITSVGK